MKPVFRKILFITIPSILVFFIVLEACLRISGYLYKQYRNPGVYARTTESSEGAFSILCLGDSFTYGAGASFEYSYPRQLELMLNRAGIGKKVMVQNLGSPGGNSYRILKIFTENINKYRPKIAIVMVGMNNSWNLEGMQRFNRLPLLNKLKIDIYDLRLYKLCKLLSINFRKKISMESDAGDRRVPRTNLQNDVAADKWKELKEKVKFYRGTGRSDMAIQELSGALDEYPDGYGEMVLFLREMGNYDLALSYAKKALQHSPQNLQNNAWLHLELVYIYRAKKDWDLARKEMDYAVQNILTIQSIFPEMHNICNKESGLDFDVEISKLRKVISAIHDKKGTGILDMLIYLEKNQKEKSKILASDLLKFINIARESGIRLILMTYPQKESSNDIIRNLAIKYSIVFIDNELVFREKPNKDELFNLDTHCNGRGYKVIAENIYSKLLEMGVFSETK